MCAVPDL
jgi:hypothetical protein